MNAINNGVCFMHAWELVPFSGVLKPIKKPWIRLPGYLIARTTPNKSRG